MKNLAPEETGSNTRTTRQVMVVYENSVAREHAAQYCNHLKLQSPAEPSHSIHWCSFALLRNSKLAHIAVAKAAIADMLVFAIFAKGDLPSDIKLWIERWLGKRSEHHGALVGLVVDRPASSIEIASLKEVYLRHTAHRAGLDYLSHLPPAGEKVIPDSLDSFSQRAEEMSSLLDQMLHAQPFLRRLS